jgi:hypothetical protein
MGAIGKICGDCGEDIEGDHDAGMAKTEEESSCHWETSWTEIDEGTGGVVDRCVLGQLRG